jgi:hypothetical protein
MEKSEEKSAEETREIEEKSAEERQKSKGKLAEGVMGREEVKGLGRKGGSDTKHGSGPRPPTTSEGPPQFVIALIIILVIAGLGGAIFYMLKMRKS